MPTELNFNKNDEDDKEKQPNLLGDSSGAQGSAGVSGMQGGSEGVARPSTPSGRPNIQQYLQANQGAGQKLAGGIEGKTQVQAKDLLSGVNKTRKELQESSKPLEENLGEAGSQRIQTAFKDPSALLQQQQQLADFQRLRDQGYNTDIQNLGQNIGQQQQGLQSKAGQLGQTAELAGNEPGRFQLLRDTFGQPNYTRGQQRLDQLFLQAQPGSAKNLQQSLNTIQSEANKNVQGLNTETQAKLAALQNLSGERANQWKNLLSGGTSADLESDINQRGLEDIGVSSQQRLADAQAAVAQVPGLRERLNQNKLTKADLETLGLTAGQRLYDVNLGQFINQQDFSPTFTSTADPMEFARYRALQQLAGDTSGDIFGGATEAGGFKPYEFNKDALTAAIDKSTKHFEEDEFNAAKQNAISNVDRLQSGMAGWARDELKGIISQATNPDDLRKRMTNYINMFQGWRPGTFNLLDPYLQELNKQRGNVINVADLANGTYNVT